MTAPVRAAVALGANLGDARAAVLAAAKALAALPGVRRCALSPLYRSAPVEADGPDFVNAVAVLETTLPARELLAQLHAIEHAHGRERPYRNAPRRLDLDLLLYGDAVIDAPGLHVPHPRMHLRAFALVPLLDLWPDAVVPGHGAARRLLSEVAGQAIEPLPA
jgi:2-amino-4-hydroxy-6-hydroxymethyldihydropteridine diphosphokinase